MADESKKENNQDLEKAKEKEEVLDLNPKQILFCKLYTQNKELFGNGTLCYAEAYEHNLDILSREREKDKNGKEIPRSSEYEKQYDICSVMASNLLRNIKIQKFITKCLNELLTDEYVDGELARVIQQNYELPAKVSAIKEYNKLKARITDKMDVTSAGLPINLVTYQKKDESKG